MHGSDSPELVATLEELDRRMAAYLARVDEKAGPGRSVLVVTADHGMAPEPPPGRCFRTEDVVAALLEGLEMYAAAFTGDEVRAAQARLR